MQPINSTNPTYYPPMRTTTPCPVSTLPRSECYGGLSFVNKYMDCTQLASIELGIIIGFLILSLAYCCVKFVDRPLRRPVQLERVFTFSPTRSVDSDSEDEHVEYLDVCSGLSPRVINDEVGRVRTPEINPETVQVEMMETYMGVIENTQKRQSHEKDDILSVN